MHADIVSGQGDGCAGWSVNRPDQRTHTHAHFKNKSWPKTRVRQMNDVNTKCRWRIKNSCKQRARAVGKSRSVTNGWMRFAQNYTPQSSQATEFRANTHTHKHIQRIERKRENETNTRKKVKAAAWSLFTLDTARMVKIRTYAFCSTSGRFCAALFGQSRDQLAVVVRGDWGGREIKWPFKEALGRKKRKEARMDVTTHERTTCQWYKKNTSNGEQPKDISTNIFLLVGKSFFINTNVVGPRERKIIRSRCEKKRWATKRAS